MQPSASVAEHMSRAHPLETDTEKDARTTTSSDPVCRGASLDSDNDTDAGESLSRQMHPLSVPVSPPRALESDAAISDGSRAQTKNPQPKPDTNTDASIAISSIAVCRDKCTHCRCPFCQWLTSLMQPSALAPEHRPIDPQPKADIDTDATVGTTISSVSVCRDSCTHCPCPCHL